MSTRSSIVNILASTFFGAISGSSVADTASVGSVLIPEMEKKGYPRDFATAVTVSGSVQAILIPPSHNAVIYSLAAGGTVSIAALFIAGVLPGLLLGLTLAIMCLYMARKRNYPKGEVIPVPVLCSVTFGEPVKLGAGEDRADFLRRSRDAVVALRDV